MSKLAILQMADTPQIESTAVMLRHAGYDEIRVCGPALRNGLTLAGCDTVLAVSQMISLGYDKLDPGILEATPNDMKRCDLFVEIKVRNVDKIRNQWPNLANKIAYWRVNGAQPEICPKGGDEVNLPCPIITACLWYGTARYYQDENTKPKQDQSSLEHIANQPVTYQELLFTSESAQTGINGMAYTFWPPYPRSADYDNVNRSKLLFFEPPYCVCHSARAWGYGPIVDQCVNLGVKFYGNNSPAGQVHHRQVPYIAAKAKALVHLKSVDCPGWALYEALLAGCPVITGRLLNSRMLAYDLLVNKQTCIEFGVPATLEYGRGDMNYSKCLSDIEVALEQLSDPQENYRIGQKGRTILNELMWSVSKDGNSFNEFMQRWFK